VAVAAGSAGVVTSPSPPAQSAKHKQRCPQPEEPLGGLEEAREDCLCTIPQLNGNGDVSCALIWRCSRPRLRHRPHRCPHPAGPATVKNKCCICNDN
jgi:hypothetical protein